MCQTEHTVQTGAGQVSRLRVTHHDYAAIQYEFYILGERSLKHYRFM
jgi:carbonic anhydrase